MNTETSTSTSTSTSATAIFPILSIDAWRYDGGWTWNAWYRVGEFELTKDQFDAIANSPRKLFALLREHGYLSERSKGKVYLDDDGYNLTIADRSTGEPLYAVEYGPLFDL